MIRSILISFCLCVGLSSTAQERITIHDDAFIVIDNGAYFVIDNSNANALVTSGTGGNIISENEWDIVQWNIGTSTGAYTIPWTTTPISQSGNGTKIPLTVDVTAAGVGSGLLSLSTYETTDSNTPWPSDVTNMNSLILAGADGSLYVTDRFWNIDANSYTTKPGVTLSMNYDPASNELGGTNTITEANLRAQKFNSTLGEWTGLEGTIDTGNDRVTSIVVPSTEFFQTWTLVDMTVPLPVEFTEFTATCSSNNVELNWTTNSEHNNDYFLLEVSSGGVIFDEIIKVPSAGNSNSTQNYSFLAERVTDQIQYYRLSQTDLDGVLTELHTFSNICLDDDFNISHITFDDNQLKLEISSPTNEQLRIMLLDSQGRSVLQEQTQVIAGTNAIILKTDSHWAQGIYILSIGGKNIQFIEKLWHD